MLMENRRGKKNAAFRAGAHAGVFDNLSGHPQGTYIGSVQRNYPVRDMQIIRLKKP